VTTRGYFCNKCSEPTGRLNFDFDYDEPSSMKGRNMPTLEEYRKQTVASLEALGISAPTEEDLVTAPLEGFDFGAGSFIAHWSMGQYYRVQTREDYILHNQNADEQVPPPDLSPVKPNETFYLFYRDKDVAKLVHKILNEEEGFSGDTFTFWVRIESLSKGHKRDQYGNRKTRHEYNFLSLPPAIAAIATAYGYEVPEYDLSPLIAPGASEEFDDEFFDEHMGPTDGNYEGTFYDEQRRALWKALDEDDPRKTAMKGSVYFDKSGKKRKNSLATESEKLSKCLAIVQAKDEDGKDITLWARMVRVPNPGGSGYPVPTITEIFVNEEHATLVGQAELAERGTTADEGQSVVSHPPLGGWAGGTADDVINCLTKETDDEGKPIASIISRMAGSTPPIRRELLADSFLDSWADLVAWAEYIERAEGNK
jgi:hypothetical protein